MRPLLKQQLEVAAGSPAVSRITRRRLLRKRLILAYHGIIPRGERAAGERDLFVSQDDFARQLDVLSSEAEVVQLDRLDAGIGDRPRVAITFDDAYRGAVSEGVFEVAQRGLPATIFVAPALLNDHVFWWDALADKSASLDPEIRQRGLDTLRGLDDRIKAWAAGAGVSVEESLPAYARTATVAELSAAAALPGITVGSHSWRHPNLARLPLNEVRTELNRSREWLRSRFSGKALNWLAYPYGLASEDVRTAVAEEGFDGALGITGGWHRAEDVSRFARPRFSVSAGLSVAGLRARLRGGLPT